MAMTLGLVSRVGRCFDLLVDWAHLLKEVCLDIKITTVWSLKKALKAFN